MERYNNLCGELATLSNELASTRAVSAKSKKRQRHRVKHSLVFGTMFVMVVYLILRSLASLDDDMKAHITPTNTSPADFEVIDVSQIGEHNTKAEVDLHVNAGEMPRKRTADIGWRVQEVYDFESVLWPGNLDRRLG